MAHVFLSYSRKDTDFMRQLRADLRDEGLDVWTDETGLEPGTPSWEHAIVRALQESQCMVIVLSPDAAQSRWVGRELIAADELDLRIFPVLARGESVDAVPLRLKAHQRTDARRDYDAALRKLIPAICKHVGIESRSEQGQREERERERQEREEARQRAREEAERRAEQARLRRQETQQQAAGGVRSVLRVLWPVGVILGVVFAAVLFGLPLAQNVLSQSIGADTGENPTSQETAPAVTSTPVIFEPVLTADDCRTAGWPETACTGVELNDEWTPVIQEFGGIEMALVPAGCFTMGSTEEEIDNALQACRDARGQGFCTQWFDDERSQSEQCFDEPFWIDVTEVTNGQYGTPGEFAGDDLPRVTVNWFQAVAHCQARGARLPTEAEWEYAARGPDRLVYPWGNRFDGSLANVCDANCTAPFRDADSDDGYETVSPVGSYPGGASWVGAMDMSGNLWEWVNSIDSGYPYDATDGREVDGGTDSSSERVIRGGSWFDDASGLRTADRDQFDPDYTDNDVGFRCARPY